MIACEQQHTGASFDGMAYLDLSHLDIQLNQLLDNCHKISC